MPESLDDLALHLSEILAEAEHDDLDRHEVADLLERFADEVRNGYTDLPEHRGEWSTEVHAEGDDDE